MKFIYLNRHQFLIASAIFLGLPMAAQAQGMGPGEHDCGGMMHERGHGGPGGEGRPHLPPGLNLSDAQKDRIFEIHHAQAPIMREKAKQLHNANKELRALARSPKYDEAQAKALADTSAKALAEMALLRTQGEHQVYELLTPEQRKKFDEAMSKDGPRGMMGGHRRGGEPGRGGEMQNKG